MASSASSDGALEETESVTSVLFGLTTTKDVNGVTNPYFKASRVARCFGVSGTRMVTFLGIEPVTPTGATAETLATVVVVAGTDSISLDSISLLRSSSI